jgi:predicted dehydrogenase
MLSRRRFLAASTAAVASAPFVKSFAANEPKEKVRLAVVGVANRGGANLAGVATEDIVALCDIDPAHAEAARKQFPKAQYFTDYRKMFDAVTNKVDAVVVSTPDHNHAYPALLAMRAGKHVYCEKPLAHTVEEVRLMQKAAFEPKRLVTQMGTQIHAGDNYRRVVEIVKSGKLGNVQRVQVWLGRGPDAGHRVSKPTQPIKFDSDLWLGPVPYEFFYAKHTEHGGSWPHFNWRYWWSFGGGSLADFGCHFMDLPFWALGLRSPNKVKAAGTTIPNADNKVPGTLRVDYHFPASGSQPAVHLTWYHGTPGPDDGRTRFKGFGSGVLFEGDKGKLVADYGKYRLLPEEFARDFKAPEQSIPKSVGHHREWLDAILNGGQPLCQFGYSAPLAETALLGNVAYRAGQEITWDAATGKTNSPAADKLLKWERRKGWELS